ncbi:hypothetical protein E2542_SST07663 [Spatholobus suberectus]|nr:hypothetical protein E2542_SST07663 [Spatholobus suberectus]
MRRRRRGLRVNSNATGEVENERERKNDAVVPSWPRWCGSIGAVTREIRRRDHIDRLRRSWLRRHLGQAEERRLAGGDVECAPASWREKAKEREEEGKVKRRAAYGGSKGEAYGGDAKLSLSLSFLSVFSFFVRSFSDSFFPRYRSLAVTIEVVGGLGDGSWRCV